MVASTQTKRARPKDQPPRPVGVCEALFGGASNAAPVPRARVR
jgi:hypothetical protein